MSAVLTASFGDRGAIREAAIGNAAHERAIGFGYSTVTAQQFARQAKREATAWESPSEIALRVVRPRHLSATRPGAGPSGFAA